MIAPSLRTPVAALAVSIALALSLSACSPASEEPAPPPTAAPDTQAAAAAAAEANADALAVLSAEELRERGNAALREQRLYSPAGDNAMEYYLALRQKSATPDVMAESALMDLMPYALIAAEQAINDDNFDEAEQLLELMARTDPEAPSLSRIRDAIASGRAAAADRERLSAERAERVAAERAAAAQLATQQASQAATASPPAAGEAIAAPAPVTTPTPTPPPAASEPEPVAAAPAPAPAAAPAVRSGPPRAISTPQPPYPREAARNRTAGSVTVSFTIGADGRVGNVQVLRARPRGMFEDSVRDTVSTWRFEAPGEPVTMTRTFDFRM